MMIVKSNKPKWSYPTMFDQFLSRELASVLGNDDIASAPAVNVTEQENSYTIALAVPGLSKEQFSVALDKQTLTISATAKAEKEAPAEKFLRREFNYRQFSRSFTLPENVNADAIRATYENGVLQLDIPKPEKAKENGVKNISIV